MVTQLRNGKAGSWTRVTVTRMTLAPSTAWTYTDSFQFVGVWKWIAQSWGLELLLRAWKVALTAQPLFNHPGREPQATWPCLEPGVQPDWRVTRSARGILLSVAGQDRSQA